MGDYLVMSWPPDAAPIAAGHRRWLIETDGWSVKVETDHLAVLVRGPRPPPVQRLPGQGGLLIGEVFDSQAARDGYGRPGDLTGLSGSPERIAGKLLAEVFGAYVAILPSGDEPLGVLRDPMSGLECLRWSANEVEVVASTLCVRGPLSPANLAIDWTLLARLLRQKNLSSAEIPLRGVEAVPPGVLVQGQHRRRLWTPGAFARAGAASPSPAALARVVDGATAALTMGRGAVLAEVSGGLDSAIVLSALKHCGAPLVGALNHAWPQPEADERIYARAAADEAGVTLECETRGLLVLSADKLADVAGSPRPSFNAADPDHERALAAALDRHAADALVTGQGGDAVFFQMATSDLALDILRGGPVEGPRLAALAAVARRLRRSVWGVLGEALARGARPLPPMPGSRLLTPNAARADGGERHPWLRDLRGVGLAKQLQIQAITNNQAVFGASVRARHGAILQPLLSQPVVEHCLGVPATILSSGDGDRALARAAFADRIPRVIRERRHKGDLSVFFARSMAASLDFLRPWLMDGQLVAAGLLDRAALEDVLQRDHLIWHDRSGELVIAAILEAWARHWSATLKCHAAWAPPLGAASRSGLGH